MITLCNLKEILGQIIAIDGKTIRGKSHGKTSPIHIVSTWSCENNLVLEQVKTNEKSNELLSTSRKPILNKKLSRLLQYRNY